MTQISGIQHSFVFGMIMLSTFGCRGFWRRCCGGTGWLVWRWAVLAGAGAGGAAAARGLAAKPRGTRPGVVDLIHFPPFRSLSSCPRI